MTRAAVSAMILAIAHTHFQELINHHFPIIWRTHQHHHVCVQLRIIVPCFQIVWCRLHCCSSGIFDMSEASGRAYTSVLSRHRSIVMSDATTFPIAMIPSSRRHSEDPTHHKLTSLTSQGSARTGGRLVGQEQPHQATLRKLIRSNLLNQHMQ